MLNFKPVPEGVGKRPLIKLHPSKVVMYHRGL